MPSFQQRLDSPLRPRARLILAALVVPLALSFTAPLWKISMEAPQYPKGLYLDIWSYKVVGGDDGQHIQEINTLNHYIGMRTLDRAAMVDLDWIPFALGFLLLFALRTATIGKGRALIDLTVLSLYVSLIAFGRYIYMLYDFGHHLHPDAPVKVEPFMPVIVGTKQIANFTTHSLPSLGSLYLGLFVTGVLALTAWHFLRPRRTGASA